MIKQSTKRITFIILIVCLCVFTLSFLSFFVMADEGTDVQAELTLSAKIEKQYIRNGYLSVPKGEFSYQNDRKTADACLTFPDGRTSRYSEIRLDEEGVYTLEYSAVVGDTKLQQTYTFDVVSEASSLFITDNTVVFTNNCDSPDYVDGTYNGLGICAVNEGTVLHYDGILNLGDNKSDEPFFEFLYTPKENGMKDIDKMYIVLTDIYDPNNFIEIYIQSMPMSPYVDVTHIYAKASVGEDYGWIGNNPGANAGKIAGYSVHSSSHGRIDFTNESGLTETTQCVPISLRYDIFDKALLAAPSSIPNAVCDFDDPSLVGNGNEWQGFTTNEVYMDLIFDTKPMEALSSNIMILSLDAKSLSGKGIKDLTKPTINLDLKGNNEENLPYALVGQKFEIFAATVYDFVDGVMPYFNIEVFDENGTPCLINDNVFVPTQAGTYTIKYTATDKSGNVAVREEVISAYTNNVQELDYEFKTTYNDVTVGLDYLIKDGIASGGSGVLTVERHLTLNGSEYEIKDGYFKPLQEGEYKLSYKVTDYLGNFETFTHVINATMIDAPIMESFSLPKSIIAGVTYSFPVVKAYDHKNGQEIYSNLFINGKMIDGYDYTLSESGVITVKYVAFSAFDETVYSASDDYKINVIDLNHTNGTTFFSSYFDYNNITGTAADLGFVLETSNEINKVSFIKSMPFEGFSIVFDVDETKNNFSSLVFTITDSENSEQKIQFKIYKYDATSLFTVNDGMESAISGSFFGTSKVPFKITVSGSKIYDYNKNFVSEIKKYVNGKSFEGFSSNVVFVDIEFVDVIGDSAIVLNQLGNQTFGELTSDRIEPIIILEREYSAYFIPINTKYTVYAAKAYDVLDYNVNLSVKVLDPDDKIVYEGEIAKAKTLKFSKLGTYKIIYTAKGYTGIRSATKRFDIVVADTIPPTVSMSGDMPVSLKKGEKLTIPKITITDNVSKDLYTMIYIMEPSAKIVMVENEYVTWTTGRHTLWVYASDEFGNVTLKDFVFYVE